jgi:hypothetical protein
MAVRLTIMRFVTQIDPCDEMFSCTEYKKWLKTQDHDVQSESAACRAIVNGPARYRAFGSLCADIADFFDPTIVLLSWRCGSEVPNLSKVYPGSKSALRTIETKTEDYEFADACIEKYKVREKGPITPSYAASPTHSIPSASTTSKWLCLIAWMGLYCFSRREAVSG